MMQYHPTRWIPEIVIHHYTQGTCVALANQVHCQVVSANGAVMLSGAKGISCFVVKAGSLSYVGLAHPSHFVSSVRKQHSAVLIC